MPKYTHLRVDIIENLQSEEYNFVIAVTDKTTFRGLGFTRVKRWCNVTLTRATSASVVLLPQTLAESVIKLCKHDGAMAKDAFLVAYVNLC